MGIYKATGACALADAYRCRIIIGKEIKNKMAPKKEILNLVQSERCLRDPKGVLVLDSEGEPITARCYRVKSTKNTIDYEIDDYLSEDDVQYLITNSKIEINVR